MNNFQYVCLGVCAGLFPGAITDQDYWLMICSGLTIIVLIVQFYKDKADLRETEKENP